MAISAQAQMLLSALGHLVLERWDESFKIFREFLSINRLNGLVNIAKTMEQSGLLRIINFKRIPCDLGREKQEWNCSISAAL